MSRVLSRVTTLLLAVAILLIGHGLQLTLLPVHAETLGWTASAIALTGSAYFLGFIAGCLVVPTIVARVGHIRAFMVMGAFATIALLAASAVFQLGAWMAFRFCTGFALSGLYMVVESWLVDASPRDKRGSVLAVYSMICLLGMALGQALLGLGTPPDLRLFVLGAAFLCLATIPVGLTRIESPHPLPALRFRPVVLLRTCRVAIICALIGGLVTGTFWALGPVVARAFGLSGGQIGTAMSVGLIGGALAQLPLGQMSDRFDRRNVIAFTMLAGAAVGAAGLLLSPLSVPQVYVLMLLIGFTTLPLYAMAIAHAADTTSLTLVEATGGVLITHSAGSIAGPVVVARLIEVYGAPSYFVVVLVFLSIGALWTFYRVVSVARRKGREARGAILPRTTQAVAELTAEHESAPAAVAD